jgi:hypothetical protein
VWFLTFIKNSSSNSKKINWNCLGLGSIRMECGCWIGSGFMPNLSSGSSFENQFRFGQIQFVQIKTEMATILCSPKWVPTQLYSTKVSHSLSNVCLGEVLFCLVYLVLERHYIKEIYPYNCRCTKPPLNFWRAYFHFGAIGL